MKIIIISKKTKTRNISTRNNENHIVSFFYSLNYSKNLMKKVKFFIFYLILKSKSQFLVDYKLKYFYFLINKIGCFESNKFMFFLVRS
jgi:hypothetical protein